MAEYRIINIVYVKLQGSGATSKYYPIAMNFCTIFFYTIGTDWKGAPLTFQTFIFVPDMMGHPNDELYHHANFGVDRTTHTGCRCGNMVFVCFFCNSVTLRGRCAVRSMVTYFEQVLWYGLWVDFDNMYNSFAALIALSNAVGSSYYCC